MEIKSVKQFERVVRELYAADRHHLSLEERKERIEAAINFAKKLADKEKESSYTPEKYREKINKLLGRFVRWLSKQLKEEFKIRLKANNFDNPREVLDRLLSSYNLLNQHILEDAVYQSLDISFPATVPELLYGIELSDTLYANAFQTSVRVEAMVKQTIAAKETIAVIADRLRAGYGLRDDEILQPMLSLPSYIRKALRNKLARPSVQSQIDRLKTSPLKAAYRQLVDLLEDGVVDEDTLAEYISTALEEKARYYAQRIAVTETFRAAAYSDGVEFLNDDTVQFVKFTLSHSHHIHDICDFYANLNLGYGKGVVPKSEMRFLPLHPHCHCCYIPVYKPRHTSNPLTFEQAEQKLRRRISFKEAARMLGSKTKAQQWLNGKSAEAIINESRKKYPIVKFTQVV